MYRQTEPATNEIKRLSVHQCTEVLRCCKVRLISLTFVTMNSNTFSVFWK